MTPLQRCVRKQLRPPKVSLLAKLLNVPVEDLEILNRAGASALIGTLIAMEPITDKQYYYLSEVMGFAETDIPATKQEAIELIRILKTEEMRNSRSGPWFDALIPASTSPTADLLP